jgi:hypothetical protein
MNIDVALSIVHTLAGYLAGPAAYAPVNIYINPHQF